MGYRDKGSNQVIMILEVFLVVNIDNEDSISHTQRNQPLTVTPFRSGEGDSKNKEK